MSGQKFYASRTNTFTWPNGAIGHRASDGAFDTLGPYAKVRNCPLAGTDLRRTCYATGYADTMFSIPAVTTYMGNRIVGYFTTDRGNIEFRVMDSHRHLLGLPPKGMSEAELFFWANAGESYTPPETPQAGKERNARKLAKAEERARDEGLSFEWSIDPDIDSSDHMAHSKRNAYKLWQVVCRDMTGKVVDSLGGVDFGRDGEPWTNTYRRVCEAQMALEHLPD